MEGVVLEEGELVGFAPHRRLNIEVVELVGGPRRRGINEPCAVERHVGPRPVEGLLGEHGLAPRHAVGFGRDTNHVPGAQGHIPVRDQQQLVPVRQPRRVDVHVLVAEIEARAAEVVVRRDRNLLSTPLAVADEANVEVEVAARCGGDVGDPASVGGEHGIHVDEFVVCQGSGLTGLDVEDLQLNRIPTVVGRVDDPATIRRPGWRGVVLGATGELCGNARRRVDRPYGAAHADRDRRPVGGPCRCPRRRAGRRRQVEIVHVVAAVASPRIIAESPRGWGVQDAGTLLVGGCGLDATAGGKSQAEEKRRR